MQLVEQVGESYLSPLVEYAGSRSRWEIDILCLLLTAALGVIHYLLGPTVSLSLAYAIPVVIAAWFSGATSGIFFSILTVLVWYLGSYPTGHVVPVMQSPTYGVIIRLAEYAIYTAVFVRLSHLQRNLKDLAEQRALALTQESALRANLEHEMLEISEREQDRIGRDLHDSLCQHLTGTALAGHLLAKSLSKDGLPQAQNARKIVDLIEEGISLARGIARGLHPLESRSDGLMIGLEEFTAATSELLNIQCRFLCQHPVLIQPPATAAHLYRIAQEAMNNAIRHGRATRVDVALEETEAGIRLSVADNGTGMPQPIPQNGGMGLRTMAERARFIGAAFAVHSTPPGGTEVVCVIPTGP
jgi:signal transduction histidine kinase